MIDFIHAKQEIENKAEICKQTEMRYEKWW